VKPVVEALLSGILDYAGLFPPAALPMPEAVRRYADYRDSADAWLLGRFVVSASRLEELDATLDEIAEREPIEHPWQVSAIVGTDVAADAAAIARFNECQAHARPRPACVDGVDVKAASGAEVSRLVEMFPSHSGTWFEVAAGPSLDDVLREVAFVGAGAKLRAGGVTADAFPPAEAVARFMLSCARAGARWKATAGLHHAWRGPHPVTYEADSELAVMHGFLNVFLAAVLANRAAQQDDRSAPCRARSHRVRMG
jgi:hypothetical protein